VALSRPADHPAAGTATQDRSHPRRIRAHPIAPDESLRLALSLAILAPGLGDRERVADPSPEDLAVHEIWARLRNVTRG
jgi:hypothetical protein